MKITNFLFPSVQNFRDFLWFSNWHRSKALVIRNNFYCNDIDEKLLIWITDGKKWRLGDFKNPFLEVIFEVQISAIFKETLQVTSTNDTSGNFVDHDINSLHKLCWIFTKIDLTTEKRLKYVAMFSKFSSHLNWQLFWRIK